MLRLRRRIRFRDMRLEVEQGHVECPNGQTDMHKCFACPDFVDYDHRANCVYCNPESKLTAHLVAEPDQAAEPT